MKLVVPDAVSSLSHDGQDIEIVDGCIDVEGDALHVFHVLHAYPYAAEVTRRTRKVKEQSIDAP